MKNLFKLAALMCSAAIVASCGVASVAAVPCVGLDNGNYRYVRTVQASCNHVYVFGIGGLRTKTPMQDLLDQAKLQDGEALVNVTLSTHNKFCVFWVQRQYTIFGQVVRFNDAPASNGSVDSPVVSSASDVASAPAYAQATVATDPESESTNASVGPVVASAMTSGEPSSHEKTVTVEESVTHTSNDTFSDLNGKKFLVDAKGGIFILPISVPIKSIKSDSKWVRVYANEYNFRVDVNTHVENRKATLTISDKEGNQVKVFVWQAGK